MNNGAIFVKRVAPSFLPVMPPASRAFSFLDEKSARISHRRSGGKRSGFVLTELFCTKIQDGRSSLQRAADRKNCRSTEIFLTKIESPTHGSLLAAQPSEAKHRLGWKAFLDENIFFVKRAWRQLCGTVSDRTVQTCSLDENRPCFRTGGQTVCGSELACETCLAVLLLVVFRPLSICSIAKLSHLW